MKPKLNFIDLFAGAGGLSCGMEMEGMRCLLGVEIDPYAAATFQRNHPKAKMFCGSIQNLSRSKIKELIKKQPVHAVVGGPPCQGFSTVGRGDPLDQRNSLFLEFVRIVKETLPFFVVLENVTGLVAKKNERVLTAIFKRFEKLGYNMEVQIMEAQYYGVPERRRRTVMIGTRINSVPLFPSPTHGLAGKSYHPFTTIGDAFKDLTAKDGKIYNHEIEKAIPRSQETINRLKHIPEGKGIRYEKDEKNYLPDDLFLGIDWKTIRENRLRQTRYQRLNRLSLSPTILTQQSMYYHPTENRYLTPREAAKIQTFPNDFIFEGPQRAQWKQIGNAVPPLLGKSIAKGLLKLYKTAQKAENLSPPLKKVKNRKLQKVKGIEKAKKKKIKEIRSRAFIYSDI